MGVYTSQGLYKPGDTEAGWDLVNPNWDIVDTHLQSATHVSNAGTHLWVSSQAGLDSGDPGFSAAVAGAFYRPFRTIQGAIAALPVGGGTIHLRSGPLFSVDSPTAGAEVFELASPVDLLRGSDGYNLTITSDGGGVGATSDDKVSHIITAGAGFPESRGLFEALQQEEDVDVFVGDASNLCLDNLAFYNDAGFGDAVVLDTSSLNITLSRCHAFRCAGSGFVLRGAMQNARVLGCSALYSRYYGLEVGTGLDTHTPSGTIVQGGTWGYSREAQVAFIRASGSNSGTGLTINGVDTPGDADTAQGGLMGRAILCRGGHGLTALNCDFTGEGQVDYPAVELDIATGGSTEEDWPSNAHLYNPRFRGMAGAVGSWTQDGTYRGIGIHARYAAFLRVEGLEALGGVQTTNFPVVNLKTNTRGCRVDFARVATDDTRTTNATDINAVVRDQGTANYGTWYNGTTNRQRYWGDSPNLA